MFGTKEKHFFILTKEKHLLKENYPTKSFLISSDMELPVKATIKVLIRDDSRSQKTVYFKYLTHKTKWQVSKTDIYKLIKIVLGFI